MTNGTIKKVVADRGFGFITADDGKEYFFHRGGLQAPLDFDSLNGGEKVAFEVEAEPQGTSGNPGERGLTRPGAPIDRHGRRTCAGHADPAADPGASRTSLPRD